MTIVSENDSLFFCGEKNNDIIDLIEKSNDIDAEEIKKLNKNSNSAIEYKAFFEKKFFILMEIFDKEDEEKLQIELIVKINKKIDCILNNNIFSDEYIENLKQNLLNDFCDFEKELYENKYEQNNIDVFLSKINNYNLNYLKLIRHDLKNAFNFLSLSQDNITSFQMYFDYVFGVVKESFGLTCEYNLKQISATIGVLSKITDLDTSFILCEKTKESGFTVDLKIKKIFQNIFMNAKEAGANNLKIMIGLNKQGKVFMEFCDDGKGMSEKVIEEILFTKGKSTKLNLLEPKNSGEGMNSLVSEFISKEISFTVHSNSKTGTIGKEFSMDNFKSLKIGEPTEVNNIEYEYGSKFGTKMILTIKAS